MMEKLAFGCNKLQQVARTCCIFRRMLQPKPFYMPYLYNGIYFKIVSVPGRHANAHRPKVSLQLDPVGPSGGSPQGNDHSAVFLSGRERQHK